jgi:hypothetical protein
MRAALLVVLLVIGCSKKDDKKQPTPAENHHPTNTERVPEDQKPAEKPPESKPAPPPEVVVKIDCNTIITADDVAKACGGAKVEIIAGKQEGSAAMFTCQRTMTLAGKRGPVAYWFLRGTGKKGEGEAMMATEKTKDAKPLARVGDEAYTSEREEKALKTIDYDAGARKGGFFLKVSSMKDPMNKNPPCTLDQMAELLKTGVGRLP